MRKLKRFVLHEMPVLTDAEMMQINGNGDTYPNVCHSMSSKAQCGGSCVDYQNYHGYCYWVGVASSCQCGSIYVGK